MIGDKMKTLVIVAHPDYHDSGTQGFLKRATEGLEEITWHYLPEQTEFNVAAEQQLLIEHDRIIFQFPMYWYSAPATLKKWEDEVLTRAFTFANEKGILEGKELGIVTTLGYPAKDFQAGATEGFSISEILVPYRALTHRAGMIFMTPLVVDQFDYMTPDQQTKLLIDYQQYLTAAFSFSFSVRQDWIIKQLKKMMNSNNQAQLQLVIDQLEQNKIDLNDLKDQIKMIRQAEEG
ncbi:NAD(P)H-dependent oxidoreductase [Fructilactobacillus sanfranciscensis]|uniref:NAD(P)H-dependent oxidoreductase n=1 Tax=Fructilactobacillus sanfranciscensis TaxID=1625 RepID=UPI003757C320